MWSCGTNRPCAATSTGYISYYHECARTSPLDKDAPVPRATHPATGGTIVQVPHVGGLHHHYERRAPLLPACRLWALSA